MSRCTAKSRAARPEFPGESWLKSRNIRPAFRGLFHAVFQIGDLFVHAGELATHLKFLGELLRERAANFLFFAEEFAGLLEMSQLLFGHGDLP